MVQVEASSRLFLHKETLSRCLSFFLVRGAGRGCFDSFSRPPSPDFPKQTSSDCRELMLVCLGFQKQFRLKTGVRCPPVSLWNAASEKGFTRFQRHLASISASHHLDESANLQPAFRKLCIL